MTKPLPLYDWVVEQWRTLCTQSPGYMAIFDRESRFVAASQRWINDYECGRQDVIGQCYYDLHPDAPERWKAIHRRTLAGETCREDSERFLLGNGQEYWNRWVCTPWYLPEERIGGYIVSIEDLTPAHDYQRRLTLAEQELHLALESARAGTWEVDLRTFENKWSEETWRLYGLDPNRVKPCAATWAETIVPEERDRINQIAFEAIRCHEKIEVEWRVNLPDEERWLLARGRPVIEADGSIDRYIGVVIDVTEQHKHEAEIERMRDRFEEMTRLQVAQQTLIAVAHELRQPLHAAAVFAEVARKGSAAGLLQKEAHHALTRASEEIGRASQVLTQLFSLVRKAGDGLGNVMTRIHLRDVVVATLQQLRERHPGSLACLDTVLGLDALPVMANPAAIERILTNLVRNATEALGCKERCPAGASLRVHAFSDLGQAVICVEDNGGGIPPKIRQNLFEPFQTSKHNGLGIGLSICRELARQQNGQLWHEDRPGGSAFLFSIPLAA